ncbi:MAG: hypothetical protein IBX55_23095 [Methyloprofundus sp.]|nr:hypothetical protein [Methyloprofundus sp.]
MECFHYTSQKKLSLKEKGRTLFINNPEEKKLLKIKIDGCLIEKNNQACDFGFGVERCSHFVELKGGNISHALDQLMASLSYFEQNLAQHLTKPSQAIIVASKNGVPNLKATPKYRSAKKKFSDICIKTVQHTVTV